MILGWVTCISKLIFKNQNLSDVSNPGIYFGYFQQLDLNIFDFRWMNAK